MGEINYPLSKEMIDCASREVSLQLAVYPGRVRAGKMTQKQADKEIYLMRVIKASLQKIYDNKAPKSVQRALFDTKEFEKKNYEHWR